MFTLKLAMRYLAGRKMRTALVTISIMLGVMLIVGMNGVGVPIQQSLERNVAATAHNIDLIISHEAGYTFDAAQLDAVIAIPGTEDVTAVLEKNMSLPAGALTRGEGEAITTLEVNGIDPVTGYWLFDLITTAGRPLVDGRILAEGDTDVVIINEGLAEGEGLSVGDTLTIPAAAGLVDLEIIGVLGGAPIRVSEEQIFVPIETAQALFNLPGQISGITGQVTPNADETAVEEAVLATLGPGYQIGSVQGGADAWDAALEFGAILATMFGLVVLLMAGFIIFNTFRTLIAERRRDIGMLRAVGASQRDVLRLILAEGVIQALTGTVLGLIAGVGFAYLMVELLSPLWVTFIGSPLGNPVFGPLTWILGIVLGIVIPVLSAVIPARSASRLTPMDALRPTTAEVEEERSDRRRLVIGGVLLLIALVGLASGIFPLAAVGMVLFLVVIVITARALVRPLASVFGRVLTLLYAREGHIAEVNLARQPSRAAITASTITISLALLLTMLGVVTSLWDGMLGYLDESMSADYIIMDESLLLGGDDVGAEPGLAELVRDLDGVTAVATLRRADALPRGSRRAGHRCGPNCLP